MVKNQKGFGIVELLIITIVLVAIVLGGLVVWSHVHKPSTGSSETKQQVATQSSAANQQTDSGYQGVAESFVNYLIQDQPAKAYLLLYIPPSITETALANSFQQAQQKAHLYVGQTFTLNQEATNNFKGKNFVAVEYSLSGAMPAYTQLILEQRQGEWQVYNYLAGPNKYSVQASLQAFESNNESIL